ncbi:unnamed protein product, partial [Amoebophrya sp. A25]|eukprot:GSA25T00004299001.1
MSFTTGAGIFNDAAADVHDIDGRRRQSPHVTQDQGPDVVVVTGGNEVVLEQQTEGQQERGWDCCDCFLSNENDLCCVACCRACDSCGDRVCMQVDYLLGSTGCRRLCPCCNCEECSCECRLPRFCAACCDAMSNNSVAICCQLYLDPNCSGACNCCRPCGMLLRQCECQACSSMAR